MKFETQTHSQRFKLGIICGLLPVACLLLGHLGELRGINEPGWNYSISATYFSNAGGCMIAALSLCSFFLITYQGYDLGDRACTMVAAVAALMVIAFPCDATDAEYIGLLALPARTSDKIHTVAATALFGSFALMTLRQFTKGGHKRRNIIYRICGWTMLALMVAIGLEFALGWPGYLTMVFETASCGRFRWRGY